MPRGAAPVSRLSLRSRQTRLSAVKDRLCLPRRRAEHSALVHVLTNTSDTRSRHLNKLRQFLASNFKHVDASCLHGIELRSVWSKKRVQQKVAQQSMSDVQVSCGSRLVQVSWVCVKGIRDSSRIWTNPAQWVADQSQTVNSLPRNNILSITLVIIQL